MIPFINLNSTKKGEVNKFLNKFYNIDFKLQENNWEKKFNNPLEIADNMKKQGGFIPGIRPGKPTSDYLTNILNYIVFPAFCIAYDAFPTASPIRGKSQIIFRRGHRFKAENFNLGAACTVKMQACRNHFRVVEYHQRLVRKEFGKVPKDPFSNFFVFVNQHFGRITLRQRIFGNPVLRQMIVIILYMYINLHFLLNFSRNITSS